MFWILRVLVFLLAALIIYPEGVNSQIRTDKMELIIFHAGSLSVPLKKIANKYEEISPGTKFFLEPAGSLVCARKITELRKPCDILASSDNFVINELLIPAYASWSIQFATNEIVIAYTEKSKYSKEINSYNWIYILQKPDVIYSRSDPDTDPCGYRTLFTLMLAEKFYSEPGIADALISKDKEYLRPKEVDLVALLELNAVDYMFQYKSVAVQHGFKYIELPKEINLSDPAKCDLYSSVSTFIAGSKPGIKMKVTGDYISYSITVPDNSRHKEQAIGFVEFLLGPEGRAILKKFGQEPIFPVSTEQPGKLPAKLLKFLKIP